MSSNAQADSANGSSANSTEIVNGTSPKQKTPSSTTAAFSKLVAALKECTKYEEAYGDIEGTQDLLVQRDAELKRTTKELQKEKRYHTHLISRQAEELKSWDTEKQTLKADNDKLKKTLEDERKTKDEELKEEGKKTEVTRSENENLMSQLEEQKKERASLKEQLEGERANSSGLKMELARTENAKSDLASELAACSEKLRKWESYGAVLGDVEVGDFSNKMHNLWSRFQKFAEKYFMEDVSQNLFDDPTQWENLTKSLQVVEGIPPLPPLNSVAAKQMRMAAALAILADRIEYYIFAPVYTDAPDDGIRELLAQHAITDFKREATCRALVLSGYKEDDQKRAGEKIVSYVATEVSRLLSCFLSAGVIDGFRTELKTLIHSAMSHWWLAQRSSHKFDTTVEEEGRGWNNLDIFGGLDERPVADQFRIALFPRVIIAGNEEWDVVFPGAALWESQTAAADRELQEYKAAIRAARRPTTVRGGGLSGRRMSRGEGYVNGLGSPGSPTDTSFLERRLLGAGRGDG